MLFKLLLSNLVEVINGLLYSWFTAIFLLYFCKKINSACNELSIMIADLITLKASVYVLSSTKIAPPFCAILLMNDSVVLTDDTFNTDRE